MFLWPYLAVLLERKLYDAREPTQHSWLCFGKRNKEVTSTASIAPDTAISIRQLGKTFSTSTFRRAKGLVTAVSDLSIEIPKFGIFVLLGSNG